MNILRCAKELQPGNHKVCLAIGFFDGMHLGHQQIVRQTVTDARQHEALAMAVTFDRHPNTVVAPAHVPPLIYSLPQRLRAISAAGVDACLLLHFDKALSQETGEAFIRGLARDLGHLHSVCVGANFLFGHKRRGNVELLRRLGTELGFSVHAMAAVSLDGKAVSSTRIRQAILAGNLDAASQMLGRAYSLAATVVRGDGLGRKLGFPTANLDTASLALPPRGVYAVHAQALAKPYRAVLNIGYRPTIKHATPQLRTEAHLLNFDGDLYGREIEIVFGEKLREEMRFSSLEELRAQIAADIERAARCF
jgi:riboflavin kinase / FMN adenylyltransferase